MNRETLLFHAQLYDDLIPWIKFETVGDVGLLSLNMEEIHSVWTRTYGKPLSDHQIYHLCTNLPLIHDAYPSADLTLILMHEFMLCATHNECEAHH